MRRVHFPVLCAFFSKTRHGHSKHNCDGQQQQQQQQQKRDEASVCAPLDDAQLRGIEEEAGLRGFMRRDSADAKVYMEMSFNRPEIIGGVPVSNLPPVERERTEFDVYQRSTRDFTSQVTPYGVSGVGLGAGFGSLEDKRFGFLRPRKLQPFGGESSIVPKYDENGMPVDATLTKEQLLKKRLEYLKSFEGTTMSHREHFLLVDLDFEKDAMIFGNTREEFEGNVARLKNVISTYTKWERTDNFYYYGTIALKFFTALVLMECLQQYYELRLLACHYDDFVEAMEETLIGLETNLNRDLKRAREELESHRPNFQPVVEAIRREKRFFEDAGELAAIKKSQVVNSENLVLCGDDIVNNGGEKIIDSHELIKLPSQHQEVGQTKAVVSSAVNLPVTAKHPMDTTYEQAYLLSLQKRETEREMRRLHEVSLSNKTSYGFLNNFWRKIRGRGGADSSLVTPLQQEDFVRFSYAASPTSIETLRAIRRILLPRSEDYIQVVREEMLEYKQQKEAKLVHPQ